MALGFSTQTGPFKPAHCPPYFWFSHSCCRFSSVASTPSSSSRCFWASSKIALHRREVFAVYSCNGPFPNNVLFGSSRQFEQSSSYCITSFGRKCKSYGTDSCCSTSDPKLEVPMEKWCDSTLSANVIPNMLGRFSSSRFTWCQAREIMKKRKMAYDRMQNDANLSTNARNTQAKHHAMQDGGVCKKEDFHSLLFCTKYDNVGQQNALGNSVSGGCLNNLQTNVSPHETTSQKQTCTMKNDGGVSLVSGSEDTGSCVTSFHDRCHQGHNNKATTSTHNCAVEYLENVCILSKQLSKHADGGNKAPKESFSGKLLQKNQETINNADCIGATNQKGVADDSSEYVKRPFSEQTPSKEALGVDQALLHERLCRIYDKVLVVDNVSTAKKVVGLLTNQYKHLIHACDTEVAKIDVKQETPVDHGEIICFSIHSGPEASFGNGKSCVWVDVLDGGGRSLLAEFAPFFEDPSIKKVWHNYSFDNHVIENYGLKVCGFHADTMHMARLWDSSRRTDGGYSLEALTCDRKVMSDAPLCPDGELIGKVSMKTIFGRRKVKKDGSEGKVFTVPSVEELQRVERKLWVCYSSLDSISTLKLYESLKCKLSRKDWKLHGVRKGTMFHFYEKYWRPFGQLLVKMESEGMLVDRAYLAEIEKVAKTEQQVAADKFRNWASKYCHDAKYMNVGSDAQLRQLFFAGIQNRKDRNEYLPEEKKFKVPNIDKVIEGGRKAPLKNRTIILHSLGFDIKTEIYTASGWPSVSGDALKTIAGKVSAEYDFAEEAHWSEPDANAGDLPETSNDESSKENEGACNCNTDTLAYGTAYDAFGGGWKGIEACHAIAALCEVCSIDSLISNFILPLQGNHVSGKNGRIHCSLNINTETGRLSARRPNLQNQPALEKDRYKIRQAFIAAPGNSLIVADYGQLELRILAHLADCKSMLAAFSAGGDFHSRTAMNMYPHIRKAIEDESVLLEWHPQPGEDKPPVPLLKDAFASERRRAKMLNFSIAYGKTSVGLARDWKVSVAEAEKTVALWYSDRKEVLQWQQARKEEARRERCVHTLLGRARQFPYTDQASPSQRAHIERAAINTPVQGSAADVAMCAMLEISKNAHLKELGWRLLLQVHDEVILEGPTESAEVAKAIVVECMSKPFDGKNILRVDLSVDAKCAQNWYSAK